MTYGLPYKGSKNAIAEWIIDNLPRANTFVDLFFGGGAVTHRALIDGKYKNFIVNDIDARLPQLFLDCVNGKYTVNNHPEWITREEFDAQKDIDAFIALVWSFGNNGKDYVYGKDIYDVKKAIHYAVFYNDQSLLKQLGIKAPLFESDDIIERYRHYQRCIGRDSELKSVECLQRLQSLERIQRLQSLDSLQSVDRIQTYGVDYQDVKIPDGALIYCDIPYEGTNCGKYHSFDHKRFYEWAEQQDNIYISEYEMPEPFIPYAWVEKVVLSSASRNDLKGREMIYTNKRTYDKLGQFDRERIKCNFAEQISLF